MITKRTTTDIVLFSGGHESTLCAILAHEKQINAVLCFVEYGQPYLQQERNACQYVSEALSMPLLVRQTASMKCDNGVFADRNETFLRIAAEVADGDIWFGARGLFNCFDTYGDSNRQFADSMEKQINRRIVTPLLMWPKPLIKHRIRRSGLDMSRLFSSHGFSYDKPIPLPHRRGNSTHP